ncbi:phosphotransferase [Candidatus Woesearchaeota archaeon]|nr:phosphotransferase [Candidatus Woesearchaeota archaeon]
MKLNKSQVQKLADKYSLGMVVSFERIKQGFMNYNHVVKTDKGSYMLRVSKKIKTKKDKIFEAEMLSHLKGFPVPHFMKDSKGNYINTYKGHYYSVYPLLKGRTPIKITSRLFKQMAYFLAKLHNRISSFENNTNRFAWYTYSEKRAEEFEKTIAKNIGYASEATWLKEQTLLNKLPSNLPSGAIHCDVKRDNILVHKGNLSGVVDFDNCQKGPFILDMCISIIWTCTSSKGLNLRKTFKFIKHYEKFRPLTIEERKNLYKAVKFAYLSHEFTDYYVCATGLITKEYFLWGRSFFVPAVKKMNKKKFGKYQKKYYFWFRILSSLFR